MEGWIKLHRKLSEKGFYKNDSEKVHLWIHLLIKATHEGREELLGGKPFFCKAGQFTTGRNQLVLETGINRSKIERILDYFEKIEQQIEQQKTSSNRLISIINWMEYQQNEQAFEQQVSNDRATSEQQVSTLQECKEIKNYIYSEFYDSELEKNKNHELIKQYTGCVSFLFGNNEIGKQLLPWLKLKDQLTLINFEKLLHKSKEKNKKLPDLFMSGFNEPKYLKGKQSVYLTLNNWLNR